MIHEPGILTQNGIKERQTRELPNVADSNSFVIITLMENSVIILFPSIIFCVGFHIRLVPASIGDFSVS